VAPVIFLPVAFRLVKRIQVRRRPFSVLSLAMRRTEKPGQDARTSGRSRSWSRMRAISAILDMPSAGFTCAAWRGKHGKGRPAVPESLDRAERRW